MSSPSKVNKIVKQQNKELKNLEKLKRKHMQEQQKRIKPGECMKYIRCIIDQQFLDHPYGSEILSELNKNNIKYVIQKQKFAKIISWERSNQQILSESDNLLTMSEKFTPESSVIHLITANDFLNIMKLNNVTETFLKLKNEYPNESITVIIYGLKNYSPSPNKYQIEKILTEIQIEYNFCFRYHETPIEIAQTIAQFSKAISEIPYKKQQSDKLYDLDAFLLNDNKDCVRVEGTAGLSRLWQSHLTRLPLVTLEVAETVISEYSNPSKLFKAYENISEEDGINKLSDLKIRRSMGPLQTNRRLGFELSKKIYTLYNSLDQNETL